MTLWVERFKLYAAAKKLDATSKESRATFLLMIGPVLVCSFVTG